MTDCGYCGEGFSSERDRLEHELDEHGEEMSDHDRDEKRSELNRLEQEQKNAKKKRRRKFQYAGISLLLIGLVAGGGFWAYNNLDSGGGVTRTNKSIGVGSFVHWHAPYTLRVCGERKILSGGPIQAHTHGTTTLHMEGVRRTREQATLDWILDQLGAEFSSQGVMGYREPESCPGTEEPGNLTVKVNGEVLENPESYIVRDGDTIEITYR